jgi:hypothetical protein
VGIWRQCGLRIRGSSVALASGLRAGLGLRRDPIRIRAAEIADGGGVFAPLHEELASAAEVIDLSLPKARRARKPVRASRAVSLFFDSDSFDLLATQQRHVLRFSMPIPVEGA